MAKERRNSPPGGPGERSGRPPALRLALAAAALLAAAGAACAEAAEAAEPCVRDAGTACLLDERFAVSVVFRTGEASGEAQVMSFLGQRAESDFSAFFWFFDPANFEMGVKMVDACVPPFDRFWIFVSGLTNQEFTVTVRDSLSGGFRTYFNQLGSYPQTIGDTDAFACGATPLTATAERRLQPAPAPPAADAVALPAACVRDATTACLLGGRFEARVVWTTVDATGDAGVMSFGGARAESDQSAFYWFFDPANFEMGVKMVDACVPPFDSFWAFVSGLTNQAFRLELRDTLTDAVRVYENPLGTYPQTVGDTSAFACP